MSLNVGCCGFARSRAAYFARFSVVEVQQTFYKPPRLSTAQRWRSEAPPDFEFTMKAWQLITHEPSSPTYRRARLRLESPADHYGSFRPTDEVFAAWNRTCEIAQALRARIVLLQCPASFPPTGEHVQNLETFLRTIDRHGIQLAWEPRGKWPPDLVQEICERHDLIHAVDPFQASPTTTGMAYFRLHGRTGYRYQYTDDDLDELLAWCRKFEKAYCLFNNITMWDDALRFLNRIHPRDERNATADS